MKLIFGFRANGHRRKWNGRNVCRIIGKTQCHWIITPIHPYIDNRWTAQPNWNSERQKPPNSREKQLRTKLIPKERWMIYVWAVNLSSQCLTPSLFARNSLNIIRTPWKCISESVKTQWQMATIVYLSMFLFDELRSVFFLIQTHWIATEYKYYLKQFFIWKKNRISWILHALYCENSTYLKWKSIYSQWKKNIH